MTQQHFIALAAALKATKPNAWDDATVWTQTVSAVADVCGQFNDRFDRQRFLRAAGA